MSDFDKEAERERLREKYEHDEKKREVTEKMSELLLQGATMTNAHCRECGDPIFRYDGQEFCATCERAVQRDTGGADGQAEGEADDGTAADSEAGTPTANGDQEEIEVATPDETRVQFGADADESGETDESPAAEQGGEPAEGADTAASAGRPEQSPQAQRSPGHDGEPAARSGQEVPSVGPGDAGDLGAAHASLSRTVTQLARQAEATDDLGTKRDLLAATQEAAEALAALRDAGR